MFYLIIGYIHLQNYPCCVTTVPTVILRSLGKRLIHMQSHSMDMEEAMINRLKQVSFSQEIPAFVTYGPNFI
jgi:hypothetical protein